MIKDDSKTVIIFVDIQFTIYTMHIYLTSRNLMLRDHNIILLFVMRA